MTEVHKLEKSVSRVQFEGSFEPTAPNYSRSPFGMLVRVRPCADEYSGETYFGLHIGDWPTGLTASLKDDVLVVKPCLSNPAILIPDLGIIVRGYNCWWQKVTPGEALRIITDETIQNQWYVKKLKELSDDRTSK